MFWSLAGLILCGFLTGALSTLLTASENPLATAAVPKTGVMYRLIHSLFVILSKFLAIPLPRPRAIFS